MYEMFTTPDGTWGDAENLVTVNTTNWTDDDYETIWSTDESERQEQALSITANRPTTDTTPTMFFAEDGTWGDLTGLTIIDVSQWTDDDFDTFENTEESKRIETALKITSGK